MWLMVNRLSPGLMSTAFIRFMNNQQTTIDYEPSWLVSIIPEFSPSINNHQSKVVVAGNRPFLNVVKSIFDGLAVIKTIKSKYIYIIIQFELLLSWINLFRSLLDQFLAMINNHGHHDLETWFQTSSSIPAVVVAAMVNPYWQSGKKWLMLLTFNICSIH